MTANPFPFKVLFCFENESQILIEIKRTDLQSEDKSLVYKWLRIQKEKQNENEKEKEKEEEGFIQQFTFQSMEQSGEEQIRNFAEGTLTWNSKTANFNGEKMNRVEPEEVPVEWMKLISGFLI